MNEEDQRQIRQIVTAAVAATETRLKDHATETARTIDGRFASLAKLIEDNSASLQREMSAGFDRMETLTARNTKMLAGGSKTVAGLAQWAEKRDALDRKRDQEIRDLRTRLAKLERRFPPRKAS